MTNLQVDPLDREYAAGWAEEADDKIRGTLISRDARTGDFGTYPIYTVALTDGYAARVKSGELVTDEIAVHAARDVLRRKLANAKLSIGDEVGVKYIGPPQGTARSHRYRVIRYLADGGYVEASYDPDDELDQEPAQSVEADEAEARSQAALSSSVHAPLDVHEGEDDDARIPF